MSEVLSPTRKDIRDEFESGFVGMTREGVSLSRLTDAFERAIDEIVSEIPDEHRAFLIGFEKGEPDWPILPFDHIKTLPAVRWRMQNLDGLEGEKRSSLVKNLEKILVG